MLEDRGFIINKRSYNEQFLAVLELISSFIEIVAH